MASRSGTQKPSWSLATTYTSAVSKYALEIRRADPARDVDRAAEIECVDERGEGELVLMRRRRTHQVQTRVGVVVDLAGMRRTP